MAIGLRNLSETTERLSIEDKGRLQPDLQLCTSPNAGSCGPGLNEAQLMMNARHFDYEKLSL